MNRPTLSGHVADRLTVGVLIVHIVLVLYWIWTSFAVVDEAGHLGSGLATWRTGDTRPYCVNPPVPRLIATLPLWAADPDFLPVTGGRPGYRRSGLSACRWPGTTPVTTYG